ncbi:hypothetical protein [Streptomyces aurantiogriseus]|uniref:Uncharacterized protein n=1 Tax=Streptomyces aurantiogriseus TaxID=66870 RepID=A0A918FNQ1_9ACTN|nr:hypothetical protein [Streptomyces aurantiogriseus]GGR61005.1 hypothetical protein GCM10010251_92110 [Streptomyces aurantiogriseus]
MSTSFQTPNTAPAVLPLPELASFHARQELRERNDFSYRSTVDYKELPSSGHIAHQATESSVLVTATDIDVLGEWLYVQGGTVTRTELPSGQTVWTLTTTTWSDSPKFPPVPVFVSVVLPSDEPVMHEIAAAVAA